MKMSDPSQVRPLVRRSYSMPMQVLGLQLLSDWCSNAMCPPEVRLLPK